MIKKLNAGRTVQEALDDNSYLKSTNLGGQISRSIGRMLPSVMVGNTSAGAVGSTTLMGTSAYGGGIDEAYKDGATRGQANVYGVGSAGIEMATEWITGGIPGVKTKWLSGIDKLAEKGMGKVSNELAKSLLKTGYSIIGEGGEEALAEMLNPYLKNLTYSKDEKNQLGRCS